MSPAGRPKGEYRGARRDSVPAVPPSASRAERIRLLQRALQLYRLDPGLALHRAAEASLLGAWRLETPLLEVGCHDGTFADLALSGRVGVEDRFGCDLEAEGLAMAQSRYRLVSAADCARLPYRDRVFGTVVCNSVLTHVADLPASLAELHRVLRSGGRLFASVPTPRFHPWFAPARCLRALGLNRASAALSRRYDRQWHQRHFLERADWESLLSQAGLRMESWTEYFDAASSRVWSTWFVSWRLGLGRATVGALARRALPSGARRTGTLERWLAQRLEAHAARAAGPGGSAMFRAVRADAA